MRANKLKKTSKSNIYELTSASGRTEYIVRFSYLGKTYGERNFTKLFGCTTLNKTYEMFNNVKVELSKGNNPFQKKTSINLDTYWAERQQEIKEGDHKYILQKFYDLHIKPKIGKKDIDKIKEKDILDILNGSLKESGSSNRMKLRTILNPIFRKCLKKGKVEENVIEDIKFEKPSFKTDLGSVLIDDFKTVAKNVYKEIMLLPEDTDKKVEVKLTMLFGLMTARRRSEILKYKLSDIVDDKLFVPKEYTKIKSTDEFPLSKEMLNLIKKLPKEEDKIFSMSVQKITKTFNKIVSDADIKLVKGQTFTFHTTRHLFQSIMIRELSNPPLVDRCLSHTQNSVMSIYLSFEYSNRKEVFEKYWEIIRG
jgi:integrase